MQERFLRLLNANQMSVANTGLVKRLRTDLMMQAAQAEAASGSSSSCIPPTIREKPSEYWPTIFYGPHELPEDVKRAVANEPGKDFDGTPHTTATTLTRGMPSRLA